MTRPGKIPSQTGVELRTFRFRGGRLNHLASEAVGRKGSGGGWEWAGLLLDWRRFVWIIFRLSDWVNG